MGYWINYRKGFPNIRDLPAKIQALVPRVRGGNLVWATIPSSRIKLREFEMYRWNTIKEKI